jgi:hypothetical protein
MLVDILLDILNLYLLYHMLLFIYYGVISIYFVEYPFITIPHTIYKANLNIKLTTRLY